MFKPHRLLNMLSKNKKNILVVDRYNWLKIDYTDVAKALGSKYKLWHADFSKFTSADLGVMDDDWSKFLKHIKYEICVNLEIFSDQIDVHNQKCKNQIINFVNQAKACSAYFLELFNQNDFYKVIIFQGHQYESSVIRSLCNEKGIKVCCLENTFDKTRFIYDDVSGVTVNRGIAKNVYYKHVDFIDSIVSEAFCHSYKANIKRVKSDQHQTGHRTLERSEKKRILFLGQVFTDASLLFGINRFNNPQEILEALVDYAIQEGCELFIKLHPKEFSGVNTLGDSYESLSLRKIKAHGDLYRKIQNNGFYMDYVEYDTYDLIENADLCVTINSQVGFESLIYGKELILCGNSFYSGLGLTYDAYDVSDLRWYLDRVLKENSIRNDLKRSYDLFNIVVEKYFLEKNADNYAEVFKK